MNDITLRSGDYLVRLAPEVGGGISEFVRGDRQVFRTASAEAIVACDPLGLACFPMTPFVNRVRDGRFTFDRKTIQLTQPDIKHPLHGQAWRRPWKVIGHDAASAILEFEGVADAWPWRYNSIQRFELCDDGLAVWLSVENFSDTPMPASLGLHPYFPDLPKAALKAKTTGMWATDRELMPTGWLGSDSAPEFHNFTSLAGSDLDNCFTGFEGEATIRWPDRDDVHITSEGCNFMQVYTRGKDGSFCVEAQTAIPDALNAISDPDAGTNVVQPGGRLECLTRFSLTSAA